VPYIYEVSFDLDPDKVTELDIGQSLERVIGYLKIRLPVERGFVFADAVYSVDDPTRTRVVMRSEWSDWSDVRAHRNSSLLEDRVLEEFEHLTPDEVSIRTYAEVGSGPYSVVR
jgi:hypothetical protein